MNFIQKLYEKRLEWYCATNIEWLILGAGLVVFFVIALVP